MTNVAAATDRDIQLDAGRMHYVDEGAGEPLVFVHGTPSWSFEWRHLIAAFRATHRCLAPDHLGFGLSDRPIDFPYTRNFAEFVDRLRLPPFTLVVHDFGGPIGLPVCLSHPEQVTRIVLLNTWMWSVAGDRDMERKGRIAGSQLGRVLYRWANVSLRVLMPAAYGDRRKLTPAIHRQYLDRFPDRASRGMVLWPLARAILGSSAYYDGLWRSRDRLRGRPALILWGMKDSAFRPHQLAKWRDALPSARVVELADAGHWPQEEAPDRVIDEIRSFLSAG